MVGRVAALDCCRRHCAAAGELFLDVVVPGNSLFPARLACWVLFESGFEPRRKLANGRSSAPAGGLVPGGHDCFLWIGLRRSCPIASGRHRSLYYWVRISHWRNREIIYSSSSS